jgi:NAD(P)-dependent dehydrogenase (short-subunit alcohol dehydrogenase family)
MTTAPKVALITGVTQGLGLALAEGLARRLSPRDAVYLTGRDLDRVTRAVNAVPGRAAQVRSELLDVAGPYAAARLAARLQERHGGVDIVFGNALMRVGPEDDPRKIVTEYAEVNNFATTRLLRAFAPLLREGGRLIVVASSLGTLHYLAPVLHERFDGLTSLGDVDEQVAAWRDDRHPRPLRAARPRRRRPALEARAGTRPRAAVIGITGPFSSRDSEATTERVRRCRRLLGSSSAGDCPAPAACPPGTGRRGRSPASRATRSSVRSSAVSCARAGRPPRWSARNRARGVVCLGAD